ncbi:MAG TPA: tetratricopeptide repeat protein [Thermoplasmata archaeon]
MSVYQDRIQGIDRLLRVRRMKKIAYGILAALSVLLVAARLQSDGAGFKPFFLPVDGLLEVGLIMGLVAMSLGFYFRNVEIRASLRESQKYLMAKYSMGRAATTAGLVLVVGILLLLPTASAFAGSALTGSPRNILIPALGTEVVTFSSPDPVGVSYVTYARVATAPGTTGTIFISLMRNGAVANTTSVNQTQSASIPVEPRGWGAFAEWSLSLQNRVNASAIVTVVLDVGVLPSFFSTVPFLLLLYGVANVGWWVVLRPVRDRTKSAALYAGGAAEMDGGERAYVEYASGMASPSPFVPLIPAEPIPVTPNPSPAAPPVLVPSASPPRPVAPVAPAARVDSPESLTVRADSLMIAMSYPAALVTYEEALRLRADHVPALLGKANALLGLQRPLDAFDIFRRVLAVNPAHEEALRTSAKILAGQARWREGLEIVDAYLRKRPNDPVVLEFKGDILFNLGRRPEALAAYEASTALDPTNENVKQKIEEVRVDVPGLLSRALIASANGNYAQALILFDDILEVEPSNVNALIGKAVAYRRSGKSQEALNCLDLVLRIQPNNAAAFLNRGNLLVERGEFEGALETFNKLVAVAPEDEEAWTALGDVLAKMGRDHDALRAYSEALQRRPGDEEIQRKVQEFEESQQVHADILEELYKVKGVGPVRAKALVSAGFRTAEDIHRATLEQLLAVKGITRRIAEDLVRHFQGALVEAQ